MSIYLVEERRVRRGEGPAVLALAERSWRGLAAHRERVMFFRLTINDADPDHLLTLVRYRDRAEFDRLYAAIPEETRRALAEPIIPGTFRRLWAEVIRDIDNFAYESTFVRLSVWTVPASLVEPFRIAARATQDRFMEMPGAVASRFLRADETTFLLVSEYQDAATAQPPPLADDLLPMLESLERRSFSGAVRTLSSLPTPLTP
ncbi:MAG: hypothetical protein KatS3mg060_0778 [Dehalococcoidia bacterium]|nr:MAG: hypothetical protein KatS3mg060_0778 [Dehalococcoidia bacterium]